MVVKAVVAREEAQEATVVVKAAKAKMAVVAEKAAVEVAVVVQGEEERVVGVTAAARMAL